MRSIAARHALAYGLVERAHVELDDRLVGNDVFLSTGLQRSDRHDGGFVGASSRETIVCGRIMVAAAIGRDARRARFLHRQLRMGVHVLVELLEVGQQQVESRERCTL